MFTLNDIVGQKTLLHFIVCSRGPGSETMTVNLWQPAEKVLENTEEELEKEFDENGDDTGRITSTLDQLRNALTSGEGDQVCEGILSVDSGFDGDLTKLQYATAVYRAIVNNWDHIENFDYDQSVWSSVGAWRSVEHELMPMWQVEQCMELFDLTKEQVLTCDCPVLRTSIAHPTEEYKGC